MSRPDPTELQLALYRSRNPTRRWLHRSRLERVSGMVRRGAAAAGTGRALEIGPGGGPYLGLLCDLFDEVVATDVDAGHLEYLRTRFGDRANLALTADDIADSRLEPESFDLVLCSEVIEHTPDPVAALAGMRRLIDRGGRLILSTPQPHSPIELLGRIAFRPGIISVVRAFYREPVLPTGHISLLGRDRLRAMIESTGLRIRESAVGGLYVPVVAEFGGNRALRFERRLGERLERRGGAAARLLWTQYWSAERPA